MEHEFYQQNEDDYPADVYYEDDEALVQQLMLQQEHQRLVNEFSVWNECALPTLSQGVQSVWVLLVLCLVLRIVSLFKINDKVLHSMSALFGFIALWHFYEHSSGYVVLMSIAGYICLSNHITRSGGFLAIISVAFMLLCEKFLIKETEWNKIRGSVMIVAMKLISIGYEYKNDEFLLLGSFGYYGYLLNPASIIFGPFISFNDYLQLFQAHHLTFSWFINVARTTLLSAFCLTWSTCGTTYIIPKIGSNIWVDAFKDANGFRFSTYFVSYTSELTCILTGVGTLDQKDSCPKEITKQKEDAGTVSSDAFGNDHNANDESDQKKVNLTKLRQENVVESNVQWSRPVSNPMAVEIPRSLVEVVTNWNLPMHFWLKNYVFKTTRRFGVFPAILLTYFASSLLHGLNFQLSVILLSIGTFAYVENSIRKTLASAFSACIEARRCKKSCLHTYKQGNFWVICANLGFGFIAVWNLAYLGCLFDNDPEIQEEGYSMSHALRKWAALGYVCHFSMLAAFLVDRLTRDGVFFTFPKWLRYWKKQASEQAS